MSIDALQLDSSSPMIPTFVLTSALHTLRQITSIGKILGGHVLSGALEADSSDISWQFLPWLLDAWLMQDAARQRWNDLLHNRRLEVVEMLLGIQSKPTLQLDLLSLEKASSLLALLCGKIAEHPEELLDAAESGQASRETFSASLVHLASTAIHDRSLARLAYSQVVCPFEELAVAAPLLSHGTDVWASTSHPTLCSFGLTKDGQRCLQLLKAVTSSPVAPPVDPDWKPEMFLSDKLRSQALRLQSALAVPRDSGPEPKRKKTSLHAPMAVKILDQIHVLLAQDMGDDDVFVDYFMYVWKQLEP